MATESEGTYPEESAAPTGPNVWAIPPEQDELQDCSDMDKVGGKDVGRTAMYSIYENFYDGEQRAYLLDRAKAILENISGVKYAENICDLIVDLMADRIEIAGWSTDPASESADDIINVVWNDSNLEDEINTSISRTIELGDGFLIVDYDKDTNSSTISYNPPHMVKVEYDPSSRLKKLYAVKVWCQDGVERMNIYRPDRIERYRATEKGGEGAPYSEPGDEYWPLPWTRTGEPIPEGDKENALGIPVFHIRNKPRGRNYGRSELHKAIPMQQFLNKQFLDFFEVSDQQGFPQRYGTGVSSEDASELTAGSGTLWSTPMTDAKFGQFDPADLNQLIDALHFRYQSIAGSTGTPIHELVRSEQAPSGEALRRSETPLVSKCNRFIAAISNEISDAMTMAVDLMTVNGNTITGWNIGVSKATPAWKDPASTDEITILEAALLKKQLGLPLKRVLEEAGYTNVDELLAEIEEENAARIEAQQAMMTAGTIPGEDTDGNLPA